MRRSFIISSVLSSLLVSQLVWVAAAIAKDVVYKVRLRDVATGNADQTSVFSSGDLDREEWVVVTVMDSNQIQVRHSTSVKNKIWGTRQWYDHPATAIRACLTDGFDKKDCQTAEGDTVALPAGKSVYDVVIDFKYSEGGALYTRSIQLSREIKPEN
jgi:hypothetical protein